MPITDMHTADQFGHYTEALLEGDARLLIRLHQELWRNGTPINEIYQNWVSRSMHEVGRLWESGQISVAIEHLAASAMKVALLQLSLHVACSPPNGKNAVIACIANEQHDVATIILANVCERNGWKAHLLGADVPTEDLISYVAKVQADMLALSVTLPGTLPLLTDVVENAAVRFPQLPILVGGQALEGPPGKEVKQSVLKKFRSIQASSSLDEFERHLCLT